jgi:hypothetical protein
MTIVLVFKFVKDKCIFSTIVFIKDKLQNWLNQHLDTIMCIFTQELCTQKKFPYQDAITHWKDHEKMWGGATT